MPLKRKPWAGGKRAPREPSIVDGFCRLPSPAEPIDDGRLARCSLAPCQRLPLERHRSQMGGLYHVVERWLKASAQSSEGASLWEEQACLDCLITKNPPEVGLARAGRFIHHI